MKVTASLTQDDLKDAVVQYLKQRGFNVVPENISFHHVRGDRLGESDSYTASAACEMKPQTTYRGDSDDLRMPVPRVRS
jgi:hypothetical protein